MHKVLLFFILSACNIALSHSQNVEFKKDNFPGKKNELNEAEKNIKKGDKCLEKGSENYVESLEFYLKAYDFNPDNAELNYKIGNVYFMTDQKFKALNYLEKSFRLDSTSIDTMRFLLGQAYQLGYKFEKAIAYYQRYKIFVKKNYPPDQNLIKFIDKRIKECYSGIELCKSPVNVKIENVGELINSEYPEYKPIINADESVMIFTSRRENTTGGKKDPVNKGYYEDIYISYFKDGKWGEPVNPGPPLNSELHDAALGLSPDGQKLLVYKDINGGDIYESQLIGDKWSVPVSLGDTINSPFHESSASYSYDGKTLFFVSDRPGGAGGRDIYMSKLEKNGRWGIPKNLGRTINTAYDEDGVFMHPDGKTLYFSSKGHNSMGGYDIFKSIFENGKWSEPKNIGYPINTPDNDVFFSISASGRHAYYSSAKEGGYGGQDIYRISFLENEGGRKIAGDTSGKAGEHSLILLKGAIMDDLSGIPLQASIEITDNVRNSIIATFKSNSKTGKYMVSLPAGLNYGITVNCDGYLFHSENFNIPDSTTFREVNKDIILRKIEIGNKVVLNNIFFDFDKSVLRNESASELQRLVRLMKETPGLEIEVSGFTDNRGSPEYNKKLSEDRAKSVVNYLISKGIPGSRLKYAGYGLEQPVATNETEEGRQQNRRTEIKITRK